MPDMYVSSTRFQPDASRERAIEQSLFAQQEKVLQHLAYSQPTDTNARISSEVSHLFQTTPGQEELCYWVESAQLILYAKFREKNETFLASGRGVRVTQLSQIIEIYKSEGDCFLTPERKEQISTAVYNSLSWYGKRMQFIRAHRPCKGDLIIGYSAKEVADQMISDYQAHRGRVRAILKSREETQGARARASAPNDQQMRSLQDQLTASTVDRSRLTNTLTSTEEQLSLTEAARKTAEESRKIAESRRTESEEAFQIAERRRIQEKDARKEAECQRNTSIALLEQVTATGKEKLSALNSQLASTRGELTVAHSQREEAESKRDLAERYTNAISEEYEKAKALYQQSADELEQAQNKILELQEEIERLRTPLPAPLPLPEDPKVLQLQAALEIAQNDLRAAQASKDATEKALVLAQENLNIANLLKQEAIEAHEIAEARRGDAEAARKIAEGRRKQEKEARVEAENQMNAANTQLDRLTEDFRKRFTSLNSQFALAQKELTTAHSQRDEAESRCHLAESHTNEVFREYTKEKVSRIKAEDDLQVANENLFVANIQKQEAIENHKTAEERRSVTEGALQTADARRGDAEAARKIAEERRRHEKEARKDAENQKNAVNAQLDQVTEDFRKKLSSLQSKLTLTQGNLTTAHSQRDEAESRRHLAERHTSEISKEYEKAKALLQQSADDLENAQNKILELEGEIKRLQKPRPTPPPLPPRDDPRVPELQAALAAAKNDLQDAQERKDAAEKALKEANDRFDQEINRVKQTLKETQQQLKIAKAEREKAETERDQALKVAASETARANAAEERALSAEENLRQANQKIAELEGALKATQRNLRQMESEKAAIEAAFAIERAQLQAGFVALGDGTQVASTSSASFRTEEDTEFRQQYLSACECFEEEVVNWESSMLSQGKETIKQIRLAIATIADAQTLQDKVITLHDQLITTIGGIISKDVEDSIEDSKTLFSSYDLPTV